MIERVISGGQTGADMGALHAARDAGIPTRGWIPKGFLTEDGPRPDLASYGLVEAPESDYPSRTRRNVADAQAILWFGDPLSPGGRLTLRLVEERGIDLFVVRDHHGPEDVVLWLREVVFPYLLAPITLLCAGNRESSAPGIQLRTEAFLTEVFRLLKEPSA